MSKIELSVEDAASRRRKSPGRPRNEQIDPAVLRATVELLEEIGYTKLTIPLVAARAGATPPAVYRRWPTKVELVYEAVFHTPDPDELPWGHDAGWSTDLEAGVRTMVANTVELMSQPAVRAGFAGLISELATHPGLSSELFGRMYGGTYHVLQDYLDTAGATGGIGPGADARMLVDSLGGLVMMALANERILDQEWIDNAAKMLWAGLKG